MSTVSYKIFCNKDFIIEEASDDLFDDVKVGYSFINWLKNLNVNYQWQSEVDLFFSNIDNKLTSINCAIFFNQMVKIYGKNVPGIIFYYLQIISINNQYVILFHPKLPGRELIVDMTKLAMKKSNKLTFYYHRNVRSTTYRQLLNPFIYCKLMSSLGAKEYIHLPAKIYLNHFDLPMATRVRSLIQRELDIESLNLDELSKVIPENVIPYSQLDHPMLVNVN